jgi:methylaspartate ammonia-lyase
MISPFPVWARGGQAPLRAQAVLMRAAGTLPADLIRDATCEDGRRQGLTEASRWPRLLADRLCSSGGDPYLPWDHVKLRRANTPG